ncbi:MAG TPA: spore germination protein, partial [Neobacillus sp.]
MSILSKILKNKQKKRQEDNYRQKQDPLKPEDLPILRDYNDNIARIMEELGKSTDVVVREFKASKLKGVI